MNKNFKQIVIGIVVILVLGLISWLVWSKMVTSPTPTSSKLVIGYPRLRIALPVIVAAENGYLGEKGKDYELKPFDNAQLMMEDMVKGQIEVGGYCALPITFGIMARTKKDFLFVTGMMENDDNPISVLIVKKDSSIKSIKDLEGKKIGILPTKAYEIWLQKVLEKEGVNLSTTVIQQLQGPQQVSALESGAIDALFTNDPIATVALKKGGTLLVGGAIVPKAFGPEFTPFYFGSFNVSKEFADKNPETVKKLADALDKAIDFIQKNQNEAKELLKKGDYFPAEQHAIMSSFPSSYYKTTKEIKNEDLLKMEKFYEGVKLIDDIDLTGKQYQGN